MRGANRVLPRLINIFLSLEQLSRVSILHNKSTVKFCTSTNNWDLLRVSRIIYHLTRRKVQSWTLVFHQPALNGLPFLKLSESPHGLTVYNFVVFVSSKWLSVWWKSHNKRCFQQSAPRWTDVGRGDGRPPGELACNSVSQCETEREYWNYHNLEHSHKTKWLLQHVQTFH